MTQKIALFEESLIERYSALLLGLRFDQILIEIIETKRTHELSIKKYPLHFFEGCNRKLILTLYKRLIPALLDHLAAKSIPEILRLTLPESFSAYV